MIACIKFVFLSFLNPYNIMKKKIEVTLIFYLNFFFNFFIANCSLYETDKYSAFNLFFFKLSEASQKSYKLLR